MNDDRVAKMLERTRAMRSARDEVLRRVGVWLKEMGFQRAGAGHYTKDASNRIWHIGFQKMSSGYNVRVMCHVANEDGGDSVMGPWSDAYECPNSPNGKKYMLCWNTGEADIARCAQEYCRYIDEVVIAWFKQNSPRSE